MAAPITLTRCWSSIPIDNTAQSSSSRGIAQKAVLEAGHGPSRTELESTTYMEKKFKPDEEKWSTLESTEKPLKQLLDRAEEFRRMLRDPNPTAGLHVAQKLRDFEDGIAQLDVELNKRRAATALLERNRDWLRQSADGFSCLMAPVRRIPPEALQHIFIFCCAKGSIFRARKRPRIPTPLVLSAVCSSWRDMVVSISSLWADITYVLDDEGPEVEDEHQHFHRITKLYLQRADKSLLNLSFKQRNPESRSIRLDSVLKALCLRPLQWASLHFSHIPNSFFRLPVLQGVQGNLPFLRSLKITEHSSSSDGPMCPDFLKTVPGLRALEVGLCHDYSVNALVVLFPWCQLTHVTLTLQDGATPPSKIVSWCPSLRGLKLCVQSLTSDKTWPIESYARTLTIDVCSGSAVFHHFFRTVTLSRLTSLDILGYGDTLTLEEEACFFGFIVRSSCPVTSLSISHPSSLFQDKESMVRLLRLLPHVQTLSIREAKDQTTNSLCTQHLFTNLTVQVSFPAPAPLLPRLTNLHISAYGEEFAYEEFAAAVISRWNPDEDISTKMGVDCLRFVEVMFHDGPAPEAASDSLTRLRAFKNLGLGLAISEGRTRKKTKKQKIVETVEPPPV
ncbi:hypothetical protein AAF712_013471 [Marasmius tenuissimus]|uniref:F-box domain-containing protein n=1 Tax=Marasmius tenuissimus TaxID=585030 RepID=A0ABR2ZFL9_9AGAR